MELLLQISGYDRGAVLTVTASVFLCFRNLNLPREVHAQVLSTTRESGLPQEDTSMEPFILGILMGFF